MHISRRMHTCTEQNVLFIRQLQLQSASLFSCIVNYISSAFSTGSCCSHVQKDILVKFEFCRLSMKRFRLSLVTCGENLKFSSPQLCLSPSPSEISAVSVMQKFALRSNFTSVLFVLSASEIRFPSVIPQCGIRSSLSVLFDLRAPAMLEIPSSPMCLLAPIYLRIVDSLV